MQGQGARNLECGGAYDEDEATKFHRHGELLQVFLQAALGCVGTLGGVVREEFEVGMATRASASFRRDEEDRGT